MEASAPCDCARPRGSSHLWGQRVCGEVTTLVGDDPFFRLKTETTIGVGVWATSEAAVKQLHQPSFGQLLPIPPAWLHWIYEKGPDELVGYVMERMHSTYNFTCGLGGRLNHGVDCRLAFAAGGSTCLLAPQTKADSAALTAQLAAKPAFLHLNYRGVANFEALDTISLEHRRAAVLPTIRKRIKRDEGKAMREAAKWEEIEKKRKREAWLRRERGGRHRAHPPSDRGCNHTGNDSTRWPTGDLITEPKHGPPTLHGVQIHGWVRRGRPGRTTPGTPRPGASRPESPSRTARGGAGDASTVGPRVAVFCLRCVLLYLVEPLSHARDAKEGVRPAAVAGAGADGMTEEGRGMHGQLFMFCEVDRASRGVHCRNEADRNALIEAGHLALRSGMAYVQATTSRKSTHAGLQIHQYGTILDSTGARTHSHAGLVKEDCGLPPPTTYTFDDGTEMQFVPIHLKDKVVKKTGTVVHTGGGTQQHSNTGCSGKRGTTPERGWEEEEVKIQKKKRKKNGRESGGAVEAKKKDGGGPSGPPLRGDTSGRLFGTLSPPSR